MQWLRGCLQVHVALYDATSSVLRRDGGSGVFGGVCLQRLSDEAIDPVFEKAHPRVDTWSVGLAAGGRTPGYHAGDVVQALANLSN
jgi:hypothetical protein